MKSEWDFRFSTRGFRFDREYKYKLSFDEPIPNGNGDLQVIEPTVRIVPSTHDPFPGTDQVGSLHILVPGGPNESRGLAMYCAKMVSERVSFSQGHFELHGGLIACLRIPESPEEEAEVGDAPYFVEARLIEDTGPDRFDSAALQATPGSQQKLRLMSQFNESARLDQPLAKFMGLFRVIEGISHQPGRSLRSSLLENRHLQEAFDEIESGTSYSDFTQRICDARHKCAHLKLQGDFGYTPIDRATGEEIAPLLDLVERLAFRAIETWDP